MNMILVAFLFFLLSTVTSTRRSHFTSYYQHNKRLNSSSSSYSSSASTSGWITAGATWYGDPNGAGSSGGSCGYQDAVYSYPFSSMVTAVSPNLYYSGDGCGACYKIKCNSHRSCSNKPVRVVLTDSCPGCLPGHAQFDMSGTAFGAMAFPGEEGDLRNAGGIQIMYRRTRCYFGRTKLTFRVDSGSNPYYLAVLVEYEDGDGDLSKVEVKEGYRGAKWVPMIHSWGALWDINSYTGSPLKAPFSFRLTAMGSDEAPLEVDRAIPTGWVPGATYKSLTNFHV